jgi:hypothetical protein
LIGGPNAWAETALDRELAELRAAPKGQRNPTLNVCAMKLAQIVAGGGLEEGRVRTALAAVAREIGLEEGEIGPTINSGFRKGMTEPRTAPEKAIALDSSFPGFPVGFDPVAARKAELAARVVRAGDVRPLLASPYLVKGWLDRGAMSVVYGESNVGKSFFALDVARAVARGEPWAGCRVMGGPVFYLAAEGGRSFVNRVAALEGVAERLFVLPVSVDLCSSDLDARALSELVKEAAAEHGDPALLVADTLARSMGAGDENAAPDMGAFVRNVDAIRDATSAHVMVIHHSGKDRAKGARGHSSLRAATDTEIELTAEGGVVLAEAKKQRDMANGRRFAYRLEEIELGRDQDGDPVTTCRVVPCDVPEAGTDRRKPSPSEARVLEALRQYVADHGKPNRGGTGWPEIGSRLVVSADDFKAFAREKQQHETAKERSRAVRDALSGLEGKGLVAFNEGHVWIVKREGTEGT